MALVSVLLMSALLIALYLRFLDNAGMQVRTDARQETVMQARWSARAGVEYAIALLFQDRGLGDSYNESWKTMTDATIDQPLVFGGCSCTVEIIDETSKVNVNKIDEYTLAGLFEFYQLGIIDSGAMTGESEREGASTRLAQRILDYIDEDDTPRSLGAEFSTYILHGYTPPRNGPMLDIRELLEIPGITQDLMVASETRPGLQDLLTIYGDGRININTAMEGVVRSFTGLPDEYNLERREDYFSRLLSSRPFMELAGFTNFIVSFDWQIKKEYTNKFITHAGWFKIKAYVQHGAAQRSLEVLIRRDQPGQCRVIRYVEIP